MKACVCSGSLSVLLNGNPTEEIQIKRGLKQGDSLAPLLFLLVAEGLGGLMREAVGRSRFTPFLVGRGEFPVSLLQYADDTLCIGEATVDNLWTLKAVLRGFELVSGLKVNFWKSCVMGANVSDDFLGMASDFLNCRVGTIPFKYLGLPVGANSRRMSTWEPMLSVVRRRLGSWGNKYVSLGGRIVLINAVLNAIPIFYLSYMKMPLKVWKELVKIQRAFLWAGLSKTSKTCWVKWEVICRPKKEGGLGVRDLRLVNISLLSKWKWKLLSCDNEVWKDIVVARYGNDVMGKRNLGEIDVTRTGSMWWRDLCLVDKDSDWFSNVIGKKVGNGNMTSFWNEIWIGEQRFRQRFPRLFGISMQRDDMIGNMGQRINGVWHWELQWRRRLFVWEEDQHRELLDIIAPFMPSDHDDRWLWLGDGIQGFTVNSTYLLLVAKFIPSVAVDPVMEFVFKYLWKCGVSSKICAFSWQLLLDRIPTKDNLVKRRILNIQQGQCVLCGIAPETACHLFLHCNVAAKIWYDIVGWLGVTILPHNIVSSVASLIHSAKNKKEKMGICLIWNAFVWEIWRIRNDCIFNNGVVYGDEIADQIKMLSWKWYIYRVAKGPFMLYEWKWSPLDCMNR
ncbi:hypothetical protein QL285_036006 [Trifolium repens]|nr:hypothetical protein QL285_036006 [Trifolium repens]